MKIWDKLVNKNYWISTLVIVISIMLFQNKIAEYISTKIALPQIILTALALIVIITIARILSEEVLEIN